LAARVFAPDPSDGRSCIPIRRSRNGACIQHDDFRLRESLGSRQTALLELALNRRAVGLRCPAAEILYVETCRHQFSQSKELRPPLSRQNIIPIVTANVAEWCPSSWKHRTVFWNAGMERTLQQLKKADACAPAR
jgi:hypothetical protein